MLFVVPMFIVYIYNTVRELNLAETQYEFSEEWLGRCRTYYSAIVSAKREPSIAALTTLKLRLDAVLRQASHKPAEVAHSAEDERMRVALEQVVRDLERVIERRCVARVSRRMAAKALAGK